MEATSAAGRRALLIYVLPASMDLVLGLVLFVATVRAALMGGEALRSASILTTWSLVYVVSCPLIGRLVTAGNSHRLVLSGVSLLAVVCGLLALAAGFIPMLVLVGVAGIAAALFFPPFQVYMKDVDAAGGRSLASSTGLYTFSWSTGFACGPLVAGFLMQLGAPAAAGGERQGWRLAFLLGAIVCVLLAAVLLAGNRGRRAASNGGAGISRAAAPNATPAAPRDLAWLGWIVAGAGLVASAIIRAVFPARAVSVLRFAEGNVGALFFAMSVAQALVGLAMTRSRTWMYRPLPPALFALSGLLGIVCFGFVESFPLLLAGAVLFGAFSGSFYFSLVFYALSHPSRAGRYVAINESIVGITGVLAPMAAGAAADIAGHQVPYVAAGALILLVTVFEAWVLGRLPRTREAPSRRALSRRTLP